MKKKTKKKLRFLLVLLVLAAFVSVWMLPSPVKHAKTNWRVPVRVALPKLPEMPSLPEVPFPKDGEPLAQAWQGIKDHALVFEEKLEQELPASPPVVVPSQPLAPPPPVKSGEKPRIAIIIDDMGLVSGPSLRAERLPSHVTLSYLPYAPHVQEQVNDAKAKGHDVMLHLPMQPMGSANPGAGALRVDQDEETWQRLVMEDLSSFDGFVGVNNHMGSRFTVNEKGMRLVAEAIKEEGVFFVDSRTNAQSIAETVMHQTGVKTLSRDVFLDDTITPEAIRGELARLEQVAQRKGQAVAIGHPHAVTLQALEAWMQEAQTRGFLFVPVRELVK